MTFVARDDYVQGGNTALLAAASHGYADVVEQLLSKMSRDEVDLPNVVRDALFLSLSYRHVDLVYYRRSSRHTLTRRSVLAMDYVRGNALPCAARGAAAVIDDFSRGSCVKRGKRTCSVVSFFSFSVDDTRIRTSNEHARLFHRVNHEANGHALRGISRL